MTKRVAIIGAAYRFPGAATAEEFDAALRSQKDLVTQVASDRWDADVFQHPDRNHPGTTVSMAAGSLGDVSSFDADFFGISPREAAQLDPQQRIMLELTWEALENAGLPASEIRGSDCGVYLGVAGLDYSWRMVEDLSVISTTTATSNASSIVANRLSYFFDLHGPSLSIDTACSSAMVAFHQACQAIRSGETNMALTGGVSLHLHPYGFIIFSKASMLSANGRCRSFDADGDGYVRSEGAGMFLLKDHDQAIADGDRILAIVDGSGMNTDGSKQGLTVPNHAAQSRLMAHTLESAGLVPDDITYLEAHGTGTSVGDPIEARAIGEALGQHRQSPLPIGSVKSNLGHMETASGVAGLAKALHVITEREIPATIGIRTLNPKLKSEERNIEVIKEPRTLAPTGRIVVAVNSFGFGGSNAHVILESPEVAVETGTTKEAPAEEHKVEKPAAGVPLRITARTPDALQDQVRQLRDSMLRSLHQDKKPTPDNLPNIAAELWFRRESMKHGLLLWPKNMDEAIDGLTHFLDEKTSRDTSTGERLTASIPNGPVFVYSGNGCQWFTMGKVLLESSAEFGSTIDHLDTLFKPMAGFSLREELEGLNGDHLELTEVAQPTLFALQVGLTNLLTSHGIMPSAVIGHSVGEVAAAWASGALTLEQAVNVIYLRSYHQGMTRGLGAMMAASLTLSELKQWLQDERFDRIELAGRNSETGVTLAGPSDQIHTLQHALSEHKHFARVLPLDYAFHSAAMDRIEEGLLNDLRGLSPQDTRIPMYSSVIGDEIAGTELTAEYWWDNIRQPVNFHPAISELIQQGANVFTEVGAHPVLHRYLTDTLKELDHQGLVIDTLVRPKTGQIARDTQHVNKTIAQLWLSGLPLPADTWLSRAAPRVDLPHYAWQRSKHWYQSTGDTTGVVLRHYEHPLLGYRLAGHTLTWQSDLDTQRLPWLGDHDVGDSVVFPAAGFTEIALAAAAAWREHSLIELEAVEIISPLLLADAPSKLVRTAIDEHDGSLTISAKETASTDPWHLHSRARVVPQSLGLSLQAKAPSLPARKADFDRVQHIAAAHSLGLNYGEAFQGIKEGWIEKDRVIGVLQETPAIAESQSDTLLPPGILDSAFQLFIPLLTTQFASAQGMAFVPVRLERVQFNVGNQPVHLAQLTLTQRSPNSLCADIELFDYEGNAIATLQGARFKSVRLHTQTHNEIRHLSQILVPGPLSPNAQSLTHVSRETSIPPLDLATLSSKIASTSQRLQYELSPLLEALVQAALLEAMSSTKAPTLLNRLALLAKDIGLMDESGQMEEAPAKASDIWKIALQDYPDFAHLTLPLGRVAQHLCDEPQNPVNLPILWQAALGNPTLNAVAKFAEEHVADMLRTPQIEAFNLIEVAVEKLEYLPRVTPQFPVSGYNEYAFALDERAHTDAQLLQEQRPDLHVEMLENLTSGKTSDGDHSGLVQFETSIPSLVIIDAGISRQQFKQVLETLSRSLLGPVQLLVVVPSYSSWQPLVTSASKLSAEQQPASAQDLAHTASLFDFDLAESEVTESDNTGGLTTIHAKRDAIAREYPTPEISSWLLVSDESHRSLAEAIGNQLKSHQQVVEIISEEESLVAWLAQRDSNVQNIIDIRHLGENPEARCAIIAKWWQWIDQRSETTTLWVIACGATSKWQASSAFDIGQNVAEDAAVWGFGRTLQNESGQRLIRLVDLPYAVQAASFASAFTSADEVNPGQPLIASIAAHLLAPDEELEVTFTSSGQRLTPRVIENQAHHDVETHTALTLGFDIPGQLRQLRWKPRVLPELAKDEVEIEVKATGLNFRDVMYALGLLSDEAVEEGFAGASLGLEFSGRVIRVGSGVKRFAVGDPIVGFGPYSFSTRLTAKQQSIAKIPANMDFAAAATLPTTFFTVYYSLKHQARLENGERLLIHGAAGGVGLAAIQIGQWLGAEIYATAGSEEKRDTLRWLGVEHIYDSRSTTFAEAILADTEDGKGMDVVLNSLAGEAINQNLRVLNPFGRFIELGKRDFYENTKVGLRPFRNNLSYFGVDSDQLMNLRPALTERLFTEMMGLFEEGVLSPLPYTDFAASRVIDAFRYMQQAKQIGKVVITYDTPPVAEQPTETHAPLALDADGHYLVTGGLSGFGLATAAWLVECGARHLTLISRRGDTTEEAQNGIALLRKKGVTVHAEACDITDKDALDNVLQRARAHAPLKGIIHAATVIDDALVRDLTPERIQHSMNAKVNGARWLDELTREDTLTFFILYSSATTLFGNPGQSSYIAANSWLESLAFQRRAAGLPALCVEWGAIEDVGFLARHTQTRDALTQRLGGSSLKAADALDQLAQLIGRKATNEAVMPLDWAAMARFLPTSTSPRYSLLEHGHDQEHGEEEDGLLKDHLAQLPSKQLKEALVALLKKELATILLSDEANMDVERPVNDMGFDSLMAVELVTALEARIGIQVPVMILNDSVTINKLSDYLVERIREADHDNDDSHPLDETTLEKQAEQQSAAQAELEARHGISLT